MSSIPMNTDMPRDAWAKQPALESLQQHDIMELRANFLRRLLPDVAGKRVIEVGSGPAHDSIQFAQRGAHVTAFDCSQTGLDIAHDIYKKLDLPLQSVVGDAKALPFGDTSFDIAFNAGVLEHFTDEELQQVIDEMIRVVEPGGTIVVFCPNRHNFFYQTHLRRINEHSYDFERSFTAHELRERFSRRGLRNIHISGVHVHPAPNYLLPTWLPKWHRIEPACRTLFTPFERYFGLHRLKSLIGQDFVLWAKVPQTLGDRQPLSTLTGGPAVRETRLAA